MITRIKLAFHACRLGRDNIVWLNMQLARLPVLIIVQPKDYPAYSAALLWVHPSNGSLGSTIRMPSSYTNVNAHADRVVCGGYSIALNCRHTVAWRSS